MSEKITIIISTYNTSKYIEQCINSVLTQTYDNYEIVIIDDGSTDDTWNLLKNQFGSNSKIKIIKQEHKGTSSARNNGINNATGSWITFLDSDDWIDKDFFLEVNRIIDSNDHIDVIISNLLINNNNSQYKMYNLTESFMVSDKKSLIDTTIAIGYGEKKYGIKYGNCRCIGGKFYKKELIQKNKIKFPEDIFLWEDGIFNLNVYNCASKVFLINKEWYHYRQIDTSSTHRNDFSQREQNSKIIKHIVDFCKKNNYSSESINYSVFDLLMVSIAKFKKSNFSKKLLYELYQECSEQHEYLKNISIKTKHINMREKIFLIILKIKCIRLMCLIMILKRKIKEIIY